MIRNFIAATLIALAGAAHAESWAMHCRNTAGGPDYDASWQEATGALMIIAPGKPTQRYANIWNSDQGWAGTKALGIVHFDNSAALEAFFERNLSPDMSEGGPHMIYRDALGKVLTRDSCVVTNYW